MKILILVLGILTLGGCNRFQTGDCVQDIDTGLIWRIIGSNGLGEYSAQGNF